MQTGWHCDDLKDLGGILARKQSLFYAQCSKATCFIPCDGTRFRVSGRLKILSLTLFLLSSACAGNPQANQRDDSTVIMGGRTYNSYDNGFDPPWPYGPAPQQ